MRVVLVICLGFGLFGTAWAQPTDLSSFLFLRMEPSARASALGGSFAGVYGDDVNAFFYNPATLNETMHGALSVSYLNHLSDLNAGFISYGRTVGTLGTVGGGLRFLNYGSFERADENGVRDGTTFGASDVALTVGLARAYNDRIRYGVNLHTIFSSLDSYGAGALALDAGVIALVPSQQIAAGLSIHNIGTVFSSLGDTTDELPLDVRLGVSKRLTHLPLMISVMGYNLHNYGDESFAQEALRHITFGAEFLFSEAFNVRFGYNHRRHEELKTDSRLDLAGVGLGFGLKITRFRFDYAYNSWSALGGLHQLTLRTIL